MRTKYQVIRVDSIEDELTGAITQQVHTVKAKSLKDKNRVGIHLLKPTEFELMDAIDRAFHDGFDMIFVHTKRTWPKGSRE